ncbi:hypothetical protein BB14905_12590 [Bacillus sp. B14905]|nr:hypothetical protein BB14905_12590 [Bacillus sp. B14905]
MIDYLRMLKQEKDHHRRGMVRMEIEFFPEVTRLLENNVYQLNIHYLNYSWFTPSIGVRPPYYWHPIYEPYYPLG